MVFILFFSFSLFSHLFLGCSPSSSKSSSEPDAIVDPEPKEVRIDKAQSTELMVAWNGPENASYRLVYAEGSPPQSCDPSTSHKVVPKRATSTRATSSSATSTSSSSSDPSSSCLSCSSNHS
jgi:hypothetical protein